MYVLLKILSGILTACMCFNGTPSPSSTVHLFIVFFFCSIFRLTSPHSAVALLVSPNSLSSGIPASLSRPSLHSVSARLGSAPHPPPTGRDRCPLTPAGRAGGVRSVRRRMTRTRSSTRCWLFCRRTWSPSCCRTCSVSSVNRYGHTTTCRSRRQLLLALFHS